MTEEYRIPKSCVRAELQLVGGTTISADLFLGEQAEREVGRERPLDLLNGDEPFFPIEEPDRGVSLIRKSAVLMASVAADDALENDPAAGELLHDARTGETDARTVDVQLALEDGTELTGTVAYVLPPGEERLQDFLNSSATFFRVWNGETLHLVNGDRAVRIRAGED